MTEQSKLQLYARRAGFERVRDLHVALVRAGSEAAQQSVYDWWNGRTFPKALPHGRYIRQVLDLSDAEFIEVVGVST